MKDFFIANTIENSFYLTQSMQLNSTLVQVTQIRLK